MANEMLLALEQKLQGTKQNYKETANDFLNTFTIDPGDADTLNGMISRRDPSYKPPTAEEQERRRRFSSTAKQKVTNTLIKSGKAVSEIEGAARQFAAILHPCENLPKEELSDENLPEEDLTDEKPPKEDPSDRKRKEKNQKIFDIANNGTPAEKEDLLRQLMERMSSIDTSKLTGYSDEELVEQFDTLFPVLHMGTEIENFKEIVKGLSKEEQEDFRVLKDRMCDGFDYVCRRVNNIINPLYPSVDMQALDYGNKALQEDFQNYMFKTPEPSEGSKAMAQNMNAWIGDRKMSVERAIGAENGSMTFSVSPDMARNTNYISALRNGQAVYGKSAEPNAEPKLYRLFNGNVMKEVPAPVEEPGAATKFFDGIARFLGFKGFRSCRNYEQYQQDMQRIEAEARQTDPDPAYTRARERVGRAAKARQDRTKMRSDMIRSNEQSLAAYGKKRDSERTFHDEISENALRSMNVIHQAFLNGVELKPEEKEEHLLNAYVASMNSEITQEKQVNELKDLMKNQPEFAKMLGKNTEETSWMLMDHKLFNLSKKALVQEMQNSVKKPEAVNAPQEPQRTEEKKIGEPSVQQLPGNA